MSPKQKVVKVIVYPLKNKSDQMLIELYQILMEVDPGNANPDSVRVGSTWDTLFESNSLRMVEECNGDHLGAEHKLVKPEMIGGQAD